MSRRKTRADGIPAQPVTSGGRCRLASDKLQPHFSQARQERHEMTALDYLFKVFAFAGWNLANYANNYVIGPAHGNVLSCAISSFDINGL